MITANLQATIRISDCTVVEIRSSSLDKFNAICKALTEVDTAINPSQDNLAKQCIAKYPQVKINAIKEYRQVTGVGLKDAKDQIEAVAEKIGHNFYP